jgi:Ca2+-binding RTX toxin-like protein
MQTLAAAVALGALAVSPASASPVSALAETCHGQAATVVGGPEPSLVGTTGADVIVTNGVARVYALNGDDLICVTGGTQFVDAGPDDDEVDATSRETAGQNVLGTGSDVFTGGPGYDRVVTGESRELDAETDRVDTGAGAAKVITGQPGLVNDDRITLGDAPGRRGHTVHFSGTQGPTGQLRFGEGTNTLELGGTPTGQELVVDGWQGSAAVAGDTVLAWDGVVESYRILVVGPTPVTFHGSGADESLSVFGGGAVVRTDMDGGDDVVDVSCLGAFVAGSLVRGGPGRDLAVVNRLQHCPESRIDLREHRLLPGVGVRGVEDVDAYGPSPRLQGDDGPNVLRTFGCGALIRGGGGRDRVVASLDGACPGGGARLYGGPDGDRLVGTSAADRLVGGAGRDVAAGRSGRDTCRAEVETGCEG